MAVCRSGSCCSDRAIVSNVSFIRDSPVLVSVWCFLVSALREGSLEVSSVASLECVVVALRDAN